MTLIGQHRESLGEELEQIESLCQDFEGVLQDFKVPMGTCSEVLVAM